MSCNRSGVDEGQAFCPENDQNCSEITEGRASGTENCFQIAIGRILEPEDNYDCFEIAVGRAFEPEND